MKKLLKFFLLCFCTFSLSSCGTILCSYQGKPPALTITSNVPNANVYINGKYVGKTPYSYFGESDFCEVKKIEVRKEGYKSKSENPRKLSGWAYVNFVPYPMVNWIWGYFVDRKQAKCWKYKKEVFNFDLEEKRR